MMEQAVRAQAEAAKEASYALAVLRSDVRDAALLRDRAPVVRHLPECAPYARPCHVGGVHSSNPRFFRSGGLKSGAPVFRSVVLEDLVVAGQAHVLLFAAQLSHTWGVYDE